MFTCATAGIEAALLALGPPWNALPVVLEASGGFSGRHPENVVNRITKLGNGIQVEQPEEVRQEARAREAVAQGHRRRLSPARGRVDRMQAVPPLPRPLSLKGALGGRRADDAVVHRSQVQSPVDGGRASKSRRKRSLVTSSGSSTGMTGRPGSGLGLHSSITSSVGFITGPALAASAVESRSAASAALAGAAEAALAAAGPRAGAPAGPAGIEAEGAASGKEAGAAVGAGALAGAEGGAGRP